MQFQFSPALGETVHISVPPVPSSSLQLCFTAGLSFHDYNELLQVGGRLQLWSDIAGNGEWSELDFEPSVDSQVSAISLLPADHTNTTPFLSLIVSIPFPKDRQHFSFTYRLVYPSGETAWLGSFGHNGTLIIEHTTSYLVKGDGWHSLDGSLTWSTGKLVEDLKIAQFIDLENWAIHAFRDSDPNNLLIFTPKRRTSMLLPQPILLLTTPDVSISMLSRGEITVSGSGSVFMQTYDAHNTTLDAFISRIPPESMRFVRAVDDHVILASRAKPPVNVAIIPLSRMSVTGTSVVTIEQNTLSALLDFSDYFSLFTPSNPSVLALPIHGTNDLTFRMPSSGGGFILSPFYSIGTQAVSILSPFSVSEPEVSLPTPPPSPRLVPVAHLTTDNRNSSDLSISDMGIASRRDTPDSESSSVLTARPNDPQQVRRSGSVASLRSQRGNTNVIVRLIKYIIAGGAIFLMSLLRSIFGLRGSVGESDRGEVDECTPLLIETEPSLPVIIPVESLIPPPNTTLFFELLSDGKISFIQRCLDPSHDISVEYNGRPLMHQKITKLDETTELVEFESGKTHGGRLRFEFTNGDGHRY